jgi:hypothetical protein
MDNSLLNVSIGFKLQVLGESYWKIGLNLSSPSRYNALVVVITPIARLSSPTRMGLLQPGICSCWWRLADQSPAWKLSQVR